MEFIMGQQIQNISDELYDLCDKIKTQKDVDLLLKEIQDNGLDLSKKCSKTPSLRLGI